MLSLLGRFLASRIVKYGLGYILLFGASFAAGWKSHDWLSAPKLAQARQAAAEARLESEQVLSGCRAQALARERAVREQLQKLEEQRQELERRYAQLQVQNQRRLTGLKREIANAREEGRRAGRAACQLTYQWVWLYNSALCPAGACDHQGEAAGLSLIAPTGAGAVKAAGVTEWDALEVHAENASRWQHCRDQLNALIDWYEGGGGDKR